MLAEQGLSFGVVLIKEAGMVEVFLNPFFDVFELAEIDDKAVLIGLGAGKGESECPVVPVQEGAMPGMAMLAMSEGNIAVGL